MTNYNQLSVMPDSAASQQAITCTIDAASEVSVYATRALAIEITQGTLPNKLYTGLDQALEQVQTHASTWLHVLGPKVVETFPKQITEFTPRFNTAADRMLAIMFDIRQQPDGASEQQKALLITQLNSLQDIVEQQVTELDHIQKELVTFNKSLEQDQTSLSQCNTDIDLFLSNCQTNEATIQGQINSINSQIKSKEKSLSYMWLGGVIAIAVIESQISDLKTEQKKLMAQYNQVHQQCLQIMMIKDVFTGLQGENEKTQEIFSSVLEQWEVIKVKFTAVTDALDQAAEEDVLIIMEQLDLEIAKSAWNDLDQFVKDLSA